MTLSYLSYRTDSLFRNFPMVFAWTKEIPYAFPYVFTGALRWLGNVRRLPVVLLFLGAGLLVAMFRRRMELPRWALLPAPCLWLAGEALALLNNRVLDIAALVGWYDLFRWAVFFTVGEGIGLILRRIKG